MGGGGGMNVSNDYNGSTAHGKYTGMYSVREGLDMSVNSKWFLNQSSGPSDSPHSHCTPVPNPPDPALNTCYRSAGKWDPTTTNRGLVLTEFHTQYHVIFMMHYIK